MLKAVFAKKVQPELCGNLGWHGTNIFKEADSSEVSPAVEAILSNGIDTEAPNRNCDKGKKIKSHCYQNFKEIVSFCASIKLSFVSVLKKSCTEKLKIFNRF